MCLIISIPQTVVIIKADKDAEVNKYPCPNNAAEFWYMSINIAQSIPAVVIV